MVTVSSNVHPSSHSSDSDGSETPPASQLELGIKSYVYCPECAMSGEPPVLPPSASLSVRRTFDGATVLITGVTGFVGSVVLEQILRVSPSVKRIYVIIREKKGMTGAQRMDFLYHKKALFTLHRKEDGKVPQDVQDKVVVVPGDLHKPGLGLSAEDEERITNEVQFVVHSAASISFFEHIHTLLEQNYEATKKVAQLALKLKQLKAFVHVSTGYVNSNLPRGSHIEEQVYPLYFANGDKLEHAKMAMQLAAMEPKKAEAEAQRILKEVHLPNSYTLTKHMCEDLLAELHCKTFPVCINRPTIIGAIANLPVPGYFGNAAGLTSATLAFATGMARFTCHDPHNVYDVIPCDLVASSILVSACALTQPEIDYEKVLVVHAASSCTYPADYYNLMKTIVHPYWAKDPPQHRLTKKDYKTVDHHTAWVPEESFVFKYMRVKHSLRFKFMAVGLKLAGHKKVADMITSSWKVWKLYNTKTMDFHLFFCAKHALELQARLVPEEQYIMKMTWIEGKDEWSPYCINHMDAIRAKYFPKAAPKVDKDGNEVVRVLPNRKAINNLSEAAATNAPAPEGPIQDGSLVRTVQAKKHGMFKGRTHVEPAPSSFPTPSASLTAQPTAAAC